MGKERVISREYKVMLRAPRFAGDEAALLRCAGEFWRDFEQAIGSVALDTDGDLDTVTDRRTIRFYDTADRRLNRQSYIFRERVSLETGDREATLKFRHVDRYVAQDRRMEARQADAGRAKFEEDIKPPFVTLYSFSTTQPISGDRNLNKLEDVAQLFADVADSLDEFDEDAELQVVNGFTARELVVKGGRFRLDARPERDAECALIIWYDHDGDARAPVVAEYSFKYGDDEEEYTRKMAQRAHAVFDALQERLAAWLDPESMTKTAYVYRGVTR
jgi:hypothetical protein